MFFRFLWAVLVQRFIFFWFLFDNFKLFYQTFPSILKVHTLVVGNVLLTGHFIQWQEWAPVFWLQNQLQQPTWAVPERNHPYTMQGNEKMLHVLFFRDLYKVLWLLYLVCWNMQDRRWVNACCRLFTRSDASLHLSFLVQHAWLVRDMAVIFQRLSPIFKGLDLAPTLSVQRIHLDCHGNVCALWYSFCLLLVFRRFNRPEE